MRKTFRSKIVHDAVHTISLHTIKGQVGYRITKLEIVPEGPYQATAEHVLKVYSIEQTASSVTIDFSDDTLLASAIINNDSAGYRYASNPIIVFDTEIFNQDIYVTHRCADGDTALNYYLELEAISLSEAAAEFTTIKDLRANV